MRFSLAMIPKAILFFGKADNYGQHNPSGEQLLYP